MLKTSREWGVGVERNHRTPMFYISSGLGFRV